MSPGVSREALASVFVGIVIIAGLGLTGATIDSTEQIGGSNETEVIDGPGETPSNGSNGPPGGDPEDGNGSGGGSNDGADQPLSRCIEPLASTPGTLAVVLGFLVVVGFVFRRYNFSAALLVGWTVLPPVALAYFLLTNCGDGATGPGEDGPPVPASDTALDVSPNVPPWALLGVVGVLLIGAVGLMYRAMGEEDVVTVAEETDEEAALDEFAAAAGRAADRIEEHDADVDNAVYRAWVEMTDLLDVENPDTYSPGEFATVAIDLGMAEDDVTELTRLFNEVRYGDKDIGAREDRALSVLRNIESQYGTDADADSQAVSGPVDGDGDAAEGPDATDSDGSNEE